MIVFLAAPVIRTVARMLMPSTRQPDDLGPALSGQPVHTDHYA